VAKYLLSLYKVKIIVYATIKHAKIRNKCRTKRHTAKLYGCSQTEGNLPLTTTTTTV